jgi:hypothetical protein
MLFMRKTNLTFFIFLLLSSLCCALCRAQGALLMEEPYGFFGILNPTGHTAIYLERVCAETPVQLRRCQPGEQGAVIARYQGIAGYDWIAIPLLPYLYSVDNAAEVPSHVDRKTVTRLRDHYREAQLQALGEQLSAGSFLHGGWTQLVGAAYERRIYAFRFATTPAQDDALIERMNADPNRSHFNLLFNNCADFARGVLNTYFPRAYARSVFPDAGITTPKQVSQKLVKFARKDPDTQLAVFEIPQVPGCRHQSHYNKSIAESLITTGYAVPILLLNPYLAGGLFVDYLVRGHFHLIPSDPQVLSPDTLSSLTAPVGKPQNPDSARELAHSAAAGASPEMQTSVAANPGLAPTKALHE